MRSSSNVRPSWTSSSIKAMFSQLAPHASSLGRIVSAAPSSEHWYSTRHGSPISLPSGVLPPIESSEIICSIIVDLPSPGSPCNSVIFPMAIYGYQSHCIGIASTSLYRFHKVVSCPIQHYP